MSEVTKNKPGAFCWVELATTHAAKAKQFYNNLFGWGAQENPVGEGATYTMWQLKNRDVAGMYPLMPQQLAQDVPPHWLSYVSVEDVDAAVEKAGSLGGTLLHGPEDVFTAGRMALLQDPTGAAFALWQPREHIGSGLLNEPGTFCWNELATPDVETASSFYSQLFGWELNTQKMGDLEYTSFMNGDRPAAGMLRMTEEWGDVPPHWMVYFAVEDCDASVAQAQKLGGKALVPPTDIPNVGRFAVLQDPQGAAFSVIKLVQPTQ